MQRESYNLCRHKPSCTISCLYLASLVRVLLIFQREMLLLVRLYGKKWVCRKCDQTGKMFQVYRSSSGLLVIGNKRAWRKVELEYSP